MHGHDESNMRFSKSVQRADYFCQISVEQLFINFSIRIYMPVAAITAHFFVKYYQSQIVCSSTHEHINLKCSKTYGNNHENPTATD